MKYFIKCHLLSFAQVYLFMEKSDWDFGLICTYSFMFPEVNDFLKEMKLEIKNHAENRFNPTEPLHAV